MRRMHAPVLQAEAHHMRTHRKIVLGGGMKNTQRAARRWGHPKRCGHPKNLAQSGRMYVCMYTGGNSPERGGVKSTQVRERRTIRTICTLTNQKVAQAAGPPCASATTAHRGRSCQQCCFHSRHSPPPPKRTLLCWVSQTICSQPRPTRRRPIQLPETPT